MDDLSGRYICVEYFGHRKSIIEFNIGDMINVVNNTYDYVYLDENYYNRIVRISYGILLNHFKPLREIRKEKLNKLLKCQ